MARGADRTRPGRELQRESERGAVGQPDLTERKPNSESECIADSGAERMRVASMVGVDSVLRSVFQHVVRV